MAVCVSLCVWIVVVLVIALTVAVSAEGLDHELLEWVRSNGGYFNPKQELRYGEDGVFGVFAVEDINKKEVLASIPWDCVLAVPDEKYRFDDCSMVELLAEESDLNEEESDFAPYMAGLKAVATKGANLIPAYWSLQGQALLLNVTGNGVLPPEDVLKKDFTWRQECEKVDQQATLLVMTHGEDEGMVPITDKYNCRGGNWTGAYFSIVNGDDEDEVAWEVRALRDVKAGEQIYTNYKDYGQVGTPELLRDYGFVESYPQRFVFHDQNIAFDVTQTETGALTLEWQDELFEHTFDLPNRDTISFLSEQAARIKAVQSHLHTLSTHNSANHETTVPQKELQLVTKFCRDFLTAIQIAIRDKELCTDDQCVAATDT